MKFCKKCHRRVVERFTGTSNYVWEGVKVCQCNISVEGNDGGPKVIVQRRKGFVKILKEIGS